MSDKPIAGRWPTNAEVDVIRAALPQWALDHLASIPVLSQAHRHRQATTAHEQANDSFREYFGPIGNPRESVAWAATHGPLAEIARLVWPMMDRIAAADAEQAERERVRAAMAALLSHASQPSPRAPDDQLRPRPQSPPTLRGYRNQDVAIARQVLRERGFGTAPANERDIWEITDAQAEQLWRIAGEEAHRLPPPGKRGAGQIDETKQRRLRTTFQRVTGR